MSSSHHVIDSHVMIWHLQDDVRISREATLVMENPDVRLHVPAICIAEVGVVIERKRTAIPSLDDFLNDLNADPRIVIEPIDTEVTIRACRLNKLSDIHDRLIVAVAMRLAEEEPGATLLTADREIMESGYVSVLWANARR